MKLAVTADNHLTEKNTHPERFFTFGNILKQCGDFGIDLLVIAGDLFDQAGQSYSEFESLYREHKPDDMKTVVIPGNHDINLHSGMFSLEKFEVLDKTSLKSLDNDWKILFIPYKDDIAMGEVIAPFVDKIRAQKWILVGHGDWIQGLRSPNPYEPGVYMPLTQSDMVAYKPTKVFLGHLHLPYNQSNVYYPGSPCPIDITETGLRKLLVFDTDTGDVESHTVDCPLLYANEEFVVLPGNDGLKRLSQQITSRIGDWELPSKWRDRIRVRVRLRGYADNQSAVEKLVKEKFKPFKFYDLKKPIINELSYSKDRDRAYLAEQFQAWMENADLPEGTDESSRDDIMMQALLLIYGR